MKENPLDAIYLSLEEGDLEQAKTLLNAATAASPRTRIFGTPSPNSTRRATMPPRPWST